MMASARFPTNDGQTFDGTQCSTTDQTVMAGYRTAAGTNSSWTNYGVGPLGRLTSTQQSTKDSAGTRHDYPFTYASYTSGALASIAYPSSRLVAHCYDSFNRPSWVSAARSTADCLSGTSTAAVYASASSYFAHGAIKDLAYGNGLTESADYDNRLQPIQIGLSSGVWQERYLYGRSGQQNNGNVLKQTETVANAGNQNPKPGTVSANPYSLRIRFKSQPVETPHLFHDTEPRRVAVGGGFFPIPDRRPDQPAHLHHVVWLRPFEQSLVGEPDRSRQQCHSFPIVRIRLAEAPGAGHEPREWPDRLPV